VPNRFHLAGIRTEIVFGAGAVGNATRELERLGIDRALVIVSPRRRRDGERLSAALGARSTGVLDTALEHVPFETATAARKEATRLRADGLLAYGGGSVLGLAKAIALELRVPIVALPTTYSGSEMTPIWGLTEGGVKRTGRDEGVRPSTVLYDPALLLELPPAASIPSAWNALAHAVEALYANDATPDTLSWAECAAGLLAGALPLLSSGSREPVAERLLFGACLAGASLGLSSMGLHHRLCHVLGGAGLPHARTHAALLPHVARYNLEEAREARERLIRALGSPDPAARLLELARATGVATSLAALGLPREGLARVIDEVQASPYPNPREVTRVDLSKLLDLAYRGA
jgi:maleylacetate reductase